MFKERMSDIDHLEQHFQQTLDAPAGECPLPEPGRETAGRHGTNEAAPIMEHAGHMKIKNQPIDVHGKYDYDIDQNTEEQGRYLEQLKEMLKTGQITQQEFEEFSQLEKV